MFGSGKILSVRGREVLDSRGNPTVACRVTLRSGVSSEALVPSGASTGSHEAWELRDGGKRYGGKGVRKAVSHINETIGPLLKGILSSRQQDIDHVMIELDGTPNKSHLGANAILAVSLACAQATAIERRLPLWKSLRRTFLFSRQPCLPIATMNVLNGGTHAHWSADLQECMIVPQQKTFADRLRAGSEIFHAMQSLLEKRGEVTSVGDEGGFAPRVRRAEEGLALLEDAILAAGYALGKDVQFAIDVASTEFYQKNKRLYVFPTEGAEYRAKDLFLRYEQWLKRYPFVSIEDPFAEDDWKQWTAFLPVCEEYGVSLIGDDLLVTNSDRIERAVEEHAANGLLVKVNQIGTLTEAVDAIIFAHEMGWATSISHRSGETTDTTIADLAVASGSDFIKTGSLSRSERIAKYNRLLEIEEYELR